MSERVRTGLRRCVAAAESAPLGESARYSGAAGSGIGRDAAVVAVLAATTVLAALLARQAPPDLLPEGAYLLSLLVMAGVAVTVVLVSFAGRMEGDPAALRIGSALTVYGAVVLPLSTIGLHRTLGPAAALLGVTSLAAVAALLGLAVARRGAPSMAWPAAAAATALCLSAGATVAAVPALAPTPHALAVLSAVALGGWGLVAGGCLVAGIRRDMVLLRRTGLGAALVAASHAAQLGGWTALPPAGMRLLGVAVLLTGAAAHLRATLARRRLGEVTVAARLRAAEQAGRAAADRAHEMRNLVTGLSGAAYLLAEDLPAQPARAELAAALRTELDRLTRMLDSADHTGDAGDGGFALAPVVSTVVAVRRAAGSRIELDVAPELRAHGSPEALAQVLRNLLVNCSRHAPGARVRVHAARTGARIAVRVADDGPGVTPGEELLVTRRGLRSPTTGGSGLGLDISTALMSEHGGALRVVPSPPGGGFAVDLELPAAAASSPRIPAARARVRTRVELLPGPRATAAPTLG